MVTLEETAVKKIIKVLKDNEICFYSRACDFKKIIEEDVDCTPCEVMDKHLERVASEILCELEDIGVTLCPQ